MSIRLQHRFYFYEVKSYFLEWIALAVNGTVQDTRLQRELLLATGATWVIKQLWVPSPLLHLIVSTYCTACGVLLISHLEVFSVYALEFLWIGHGVSFFEAMQHLPSSFNLHARFLPDAMCCHAFFDLANPHSYSRLVLETSSCLRIHALSVATSSTLCMNSETQRLISDTQSANSGTLRLKINTELLKHAFGVWTPKHGFWLETQSNFGHTVPHQVAHPDVTKWVLRRLPFISYAMHFPGLHLILFHNAAQERRSVNGKHGKTFWGFD